MVDEQWKYAGRGRTPHSMNEEKGTVSKCDVIQGLLRYFKEASSIQFGLLRNVMYLYDLLYCQRLLTQFAADSSKLVGRSLMALFWQNLDYLRVGNMQELPWNMGMPIWKKSNPKFWL